MTMTMCSPERPVRAVYERFKRLAKHLDGRDPADELEAFGEFLLLRDDLFARTALPVTGHNSLSLFDCAVADAGLERFLAGADHHFPRAIIEDEALLLSALATYFKWRGVRDLEARIYDVEAFLDAAHHRHNTAVVWAWLAGDLPYLAMRAQLTRDEAWLDYAVA